MAELTDTPPKSAPAVRLSTELIRRHQRPLWRYLRFLGAEPAIADDLCQETFLEILQRAPQDRGDPALGRWLRTTARNKFLSQRRQARAAAWLAPIETVEEVFADLGRGDGEDYLGAMDECLQTLDGTDREIVALRYGRGSGREEIAAATGLTVEATKTRLRRIKERLRHCILRRLAEDD